MPRVLFEFHAATVASMSAKRKRNYTVAFKLQVVESAERTANREAGRKFGVDEKS